MVFRHGFAESLVIELADVLEVDETSGSGGDERNAVGVPRLVLEQGSDVVRHHLRARFARAVFGDVPAVAASFAGIVRAFVEGVERGDCGGESLLRHAVRGVLAVWASEGVVGGYG